MFYSIGTVKNHVKMMGLNHEYQQRKQDPEQPDTARTEAVQQTLTQLTQARPTCSSLDLETKLSTGKKLTQAEINYLRDNDPVLYAKAQRVEAERAYYERELRRCQTKDQVRHLRMSQLATAVNEVREARNSGDAGTCMEIGQRQAALTREHQDYQRTRDYARLPQNHHELAAKRKLRIKTLRPQWRTQPLESFFFDQSARMHGGKIEAGRQARLQTPGALAVTQSEPAQAYINTAKQDQDRRKAAPHPGLRV